MLVFEVANIFREKFKSFIGNILFSYNIIVFLHKPFWYSSIPSKFKNIKSEAQCLLTWQNGNIVLIWVILYNK